MNKVATLTISSKSTEGLPIRNLKSVIKELKNDGYIVYNLTNL